MVSPIAIFDLIGSLFFLVSFFVSIKNYHATKFLSTFWLIYSIATFVGTIWSFSVGLEWLGISSLALDSAQQVIISSAITLFAIAGLLSSLEIVRPTEAKIINKKRRK